MCEHRGAPGLPGPVPHVSVSSIEFAPVVGSWYWTAHVRTTMEDHNMRAHMRTLGQGSWAPHAPILVVGLIVHGVDKSILDCIAHDCRNVYTTTPVRPTTTAELLYLIGELHQTNKSLCITVLLFFNFAHNSFFFHSTVSASFLSGSQNWIRADWGTKSV